MEKYRGYRIEKTEYGFRITLDDGSDQHTHLKSKSFCKKLIDYVVDRKIPKNVSNYILKSCIRISDNETYRNKIAELIQVRNNKTKQNYYNTIKKK